MYSLRWFLTTQLLASLGAAQNCYVPNGNLVSNLKACSVASGNDAAACCFANHYCMSNGLCLSPTEGTWYRGGCTDNQFEQSGCPKFCDDDVIGGGRPILESLEDDYSAGVWLVEADLSLINSLQRPLRRVGLRFQDLRLRQPE